MIDYTHSLYYTKNARKSKEKLMNVLVTGGAGFIGSHLCEFLLQNTDCNITVLDRLDSTATLERLPIFHNPKYRTRLKFVWWDLKSEFNNSIKNQLQDIEAVIHTAASSHVDRSILDPLSFVLDNVVGTCNLLNWIRSNSKIQLLLHLSTDEVFGSLSLTKVMTQMTLLIQRIHMQLLKQVQNL